MIESQSLLTVIIFTYNHKDNIAKCIESIINQDTEYKYEVHIMDDCSIDGTSKICREYAKKYPEKIKLVIQKENTFCKPYLEMQSYSAFQAIRTKYFCYIDGDDSWCDKNKVQQAIQFLESHPEYMGWAHDTLFVNKYNNENKSYIHDVLGINVVHNPVLFDAAAPFFMASSRIFRRSDYMEKKILPVDYLQYYYHFSKGPIFYHDKIMAIYNIGQNNTFHSDVENVRNLACMFPYRLSLLFEFERDKFCTELLKKYCLTMGIGVKRYINLLFFKRFFGKVFGWKIWFIYTFVGKYGLECMNINYVYSRERIKQQSDNRTGVFSNNLRDSLKGKIESQKKKLAKLIRMARKLNGIYLFKSEFAKKTIKKSINRKRDRISRYREKLKKLESDIDE